MDFFYSSFKPSSSDDLSPSGVVGQQSLNLRSFFFFLLRIIGYFNDISVNINLYILRYKRLRYITEDVTSLFSLGTIIVSQLLL